MTTEHPNILIIMADFMGALALPPYGNTIAKTPNISALAGEGVVFRNAYCNYPLCAPSRASLLAGVLPSQIGVYDNGAEFPASIPTIAHYLRQTGYRCELSGKMHFVGPDQLHGFDDRLTTDLVPADFGWMPPWRDNEQADWPNLETMLDAGVVNRTMGMDFDEDVTHQATRRLYDFARDDDLRPFLLTVSYIQPHEPYKTTQEWWDHYTDAEVGLPTVPLLAKEQWDSHSGRLYEMLGADKGYLTDDQVTNARHGYYAMLSYIDHQIGKVLSTLETTGLAEDTIVIVTADHGTMIGERGLWCIVHFFEWAMRVPLILHAPNRFKPRNVEENVSLVDLFPTVLDLATNGDLPELATPVDGESLVPLAKGVSNKHDDTVYAEISAEGCVKPCVMIKRGPLKYIHSEVDPPLLFDLATDPSEKVNLADDPACRKVVKSFRDMVDAKWNLKDFDDKSEASRRQRILIHETYEMGNPPVWDFAVNNDPWKSYQRSFREPWQDTEQKTTLKQR